MRILLRDGENCRTNPDMASLLTQLRVASIRAVGGARFGNQDVILIDSEADIDRAIAKSSPNLGSQLNAVKR